MLHEQIKNNIKEAMKMGDKVRLEVMRGLVTAFTNELVSKSRTPQEMLSDEDALSVITRLAKQRKDSIEQFKKGNREDLVKEEEAQLLILNAYLPKLMERADIEKVVISKKEEMNITDNAKKGLLMQTIMKELKGKADGMMVREVVDSLF
jgi:hypothetical protein